MPEAFGEILAREPELAREYVPLLAGYLIDGETALDRKGCRPVWSGPWAGSGNCPGIPDGTDRSPKLIGLLAHPNAGLRGLTAWSAG